MPHVRSHFDVFLCAFDATGLYLFRFVTGRLIFPAAFLRPAKLPPIYRAPSMEESANCFVAKSRIFYVLSQCLTFYFSSFLNVFKHKKIVRMETKFKHSDFYVKSNCGSSYWPSQFRETEMNCFRNFALFKRLRVF